MAETTTIKPLERSEDGLDYHYLYEVALAKIQQYSGQVWTDYNLHDPGVTTLEILSYALTELSYRTRIPVEDILAEPGGADEPKKRNTFVPPEEILSCSPVTLNDYRKLILEVEGVKNVAVLPARHNRDFKGLYDIELITEKRSDQLTNTERETLLKKVREIVYNNRNLCEDLHDIRLLEEDPIRIELELETEPDIHSEHLIALITVTIQEYLTPAINFRSLDELWDVGMPVDKIFNGPRLDAGFVTDDALQSHWVRRDIRTSDLINVIMDIDGVRFVRRLNLIDRFGREHKWRYELELDSAPVLDLKQSYIRLSSKTNVIEKGTTLQKYEDKVRKLRSLSSSHKRLVFPKKRGQYFQLSEYFSIQEEFPSVYGIGPDGISEYGLGGEEKNVREAQSRQLKGYLMFFEQIMANYFAQVGNLSSIFSLEDIEQTYFQQAVLDIPRGESVYAFFVNDFLARHEGRDDEEKFRKAWEDFRGAYEDWMRNRELVKKWRELSEDEEAFRKELETNQELRFFPARYKSFEDFDRQHQEFEDFHDALYHAVEDQELFFKRRTRLLDHLLARFSMDVSEFVFSRKGTARNQEDIDLRLQVLRNFATTSKDRGDGYQHYKNVTDPENRSGLESWWCDLLGIPSHSKRFVNETIEGLISSGDPNQPVDATREFAIEFKQVNRDWAIEQIFRYGPHKESFVFDDSGHVLMRNHDRETFATLRTDGLSEQETSNLISDFIDRIEELDKKLEGMALVEHVLLRPEEDFEAFQYAIRSSIGEVLFRSSRAQSIDGRETEVIAILKAGRDKENYSAHYVGHNQYKMLLEDSSTGLRLESDEFFYAEDEVQERIDQFHLYIEEIYEDISAMTHGLESVFRPIELTITDDRKSLASLLYMLVSEHEEGDGNFSVVPEGSHWRLVISADDGVSFESRQTYRTEAGARHHIEVIRQNFQHQFTRNLYEHQAVEFYTSNYDLYNQVSDPYSFVATVVLPSWPTRFQDSQFRKHLESIIFREAPAHVAMNIRWMSFSEMLTFEDTWYGFLATRDMYLQSPSNSVRQQLEIAKEHLLTLLAG